jgi:hypothetical protein
MFIVEDPTVTVKCRSTKQTTTSHLKHLNTKKEHDIMVLEFQFLAWDIHKKKKSIICSYNLLTFFCLGLYSF